MKSYTTHAFVALLASLAVTGQYTLLAFTFGGVFPDLVRKAGSMHFHNLKVVACSFIAFLLLGLLVSELFLCFWLGIVIHIVLDAWEKWRAD